MRRAILAIANNLLRQASPLNRVLRGVMAWLVVLQLLGGLGVARAIAGTSDGDARYDPTAVVAPSDLSLIGLSAPGPLGSDDSDNDDPFYGTSVAFATLHRLSIPDEGQVAFGLRGSAVASTTRPTGPPALS